MQSWYYITTNLSACRSVKLYVARNDDSDDMEYTRDAIDNMILEFSGD